MAEVKEVRILKDGTAVPDPCILSKTGKDGLPKRANWVADDKEHDFHVTFEKESPFKKKLFIVSNGGPEPSDDIRAEVKTEPEGTHYEYKVESKARAIAADPEVIIRN